MAQAFQRLAASESGDYAEFQTQELIEAKRSGATVRAFRGINTLDLADLKELPPDDFDAVFMVIEDSDFEQHPPQERGART